MNEETLSRRKKGLFTILTIFLNFLIFSCCVEIIARVFFLPHNIQEISDRFYQKDDNTGWVHIAGKIGISYGLHPRKDIREPKGVNIKINSLGLNDQEYTYTKPPNTIRILLLGDSMTEAIQVREKDSFQSLVEEKLNRDRDSFYNYEVINTGCGNYGTDNELLFFQNEGYKYNPDITILCIFPWNDIRNNSFELDKYYYGKRRGKYPHFSIGQNGKLILIKKDRSQSNEPYSIGGDSESGLIADIKVFIRKYLESYYLLSDIFRYRMPSVGKYLISLGIMSSPKEKLSEGYPKGNAVFAKDWSSEYEEAWKVTKLLILRTKKVVEKNGSKFMAIMIPNGLQVHENWWSEYLRYSKFKDLEFDLLKPNKALSEFFIHNKIVYLDLLPHLIQYSNKSKDPLYFRVDGHFNANGHKAVSGAIYDWLDSSGAIDKCKFIIDQ